MQSHSPYFLKDLSETPFFFFHKLKYINRKRAKPNYMIEAHTTRPKQHVKQKTNHAKSTPVYSTHDKPDFELSKPAPTLPRHVSFILRPKQPRVTPATNRPPPFYITDASHDRNPRFVGAAWFRFQSAAETVSAPSWSSPNS